VGLQALCRPRPAASAHRGRARVSLSSVGRDAILHVLAAAKAVEADVVDRIGELEAAALRNALKKLILATDPGLPKLWTAGGAAP
jgi:3-hydroxy-9,10-secoandrosta-1,3,5(10)-triene-9,17-dione monooxygenase reductase component